MSEHRLDALFATELEANAKGLRAFPFARRWKADLAKSATVILHALADRTAGNGYAAQVVRSLDDLPSNAWADALAHPTVLAWCSEAQRRSTITDADWEAFAAELKHDNGALTLAAGCRVVVWTSPSQEFRRRMKGAGPGSLAESSNAAEFLTPNSEVFGDAIGKLSFALAELPKVAPGFFADVDNFLVALGLADDRASFRGSSALGRWGLVWFSPRLTWPPGIWAEELVHEATHGIIDAIASRQPVLLGSDIHEPKHRSPLRTDPRPLVGVFQALIVTARVLTLLDLIETTSLDYPNLRKRRNFLLEGFEPSAVAFKKNAHCSQLGQLIFDSYVAPHL
jgi:hypothetical protein